MGLADYPVGDDNTPTIPTDPATLYQIKIAINDGRKKFYSENANRNPAGSALTWLFMRPRYEIELNPDGDGPLNIDTDPSRMRLPDDIQGPPEGRVVCGMSGQFGVPNLHVTSMSAVDSAHMNSPSATGYPQLIAFERERAGGRSDQEPRWEMRVWPKPDQAYTVVARMTRRYRPLAELHAVEPSGFGECVVAYAKCEIGTVFPGIDMQKAQLERADWLDKARIQNAREAPRMLGKAFDPSVRQVDESGVYAGLMSNTTVTTNF